MMLRLYRTLLYLYPGWYRRRFGRDMAEMFADELSAARLLGMTKVIRLSVRAFADLLANVPIVFLSADRLNARPPVRQVSLMQNLLRDLRLAIRSLGRHPLFAVVAVLTIALGIGANSAIFSVVNGVMLKPLPYQDPSNLVIVWTAYPDNPKFPISIAEYLDYRTESDAMENVGAYSVQAVTVTGAGMAERRFAAYTSRSLFDVLGVSAQIGRTFSPDEDEPGGPDVAILSYNYWRSHYGGEPSVVGTQTVMVDGTPFDIIGVMPAEFEPPINSPAFYLPAPFDRSTITNRSSHNWFAVGRLKSGTTFEAAEAELRAILPRWEEEFAGVHPNDPITHPLLLVPLVEEVFGGVRPMLWVLLGAVGLVLLLATANVANLLLARGEARGREMGIRGALGAGRRDLIQQMLTESVVLAAAGGVAGLAVAAGLTALFKALDPGGVPRLEQVSLDWSVIGFTAAVTLGTGVLFGLLPALQAARNDVKVALAEGGRSGSTGRQSKRALQGLVAVQMAFAVVLLIGSGVLIKSFLTLQSVDPGFETEHRVAFGVQLINDAYPERADKLAFYDRLRQELQGIPGVSEVALVRGLPLRSRIGTEGIRVEGRTLAPDERQPSIDFQIASDGYFRLMGIPVVQGRAIELTDRAEAPLVMLINEASARAYFPGENPIGQRARLAFSPRNWPNVTIVGVVGDVHQRGLDSRARPEIYLPPHQVPPGWTQSIISSLTIVLRTDLPLETVGPTIRQTVQRLDPTVPVSQLGTLDQAIANNVATERFVTILLTLFAAVALIISAVGVYGVMAFSVARRTREIGIRLALGAEPGQVLGSILKGALTIAAIGGGIGLVTAFLATSVLESLVYQVSVRDTVVFIVSPIVLMLVALVASLVPAWRAAAVHPMETLRAE
ncbi:MAG: ABC transporter permease [Gemmatimonadetes bacterium]|nr:ABC transporter permease [Gemmatimonadota bacterium]